MAWRMGRLVALVLMSPLIVTSSAVAQGTVSATLSVVAAPVERVAAGGSGAERGVDGMNLAGLDLQRDHTSDPAVFNNQGKDVPFFINKDIIL